VYNNTVAETFLGDELFGADMTIPIEERVDKSVKKVQKLSASTKSAVGLTGKGGGKSSKRGRGRDSYRGGYQHNGAEETTISAHATATTRGFFPRGGYNGSHHGNFDRGGGSGTCFICGSTGHQAKQCPKAL
jgi:hypothetical protein